MSSDKPVGHDPSLCNCGPEWRKPKPSGVCATCGGWLPGEKPPSLTAMWSGKDESGFGHFDMHGEYDNG